MDKANRLLPCPHCGGTDINDRGAPGHYSVECRCFMGGFETRDGARICNKPLPFRYGDMVRQIKESAVCYDSSFTAKVQACFQITDGYQQNQWLVAVLPITGDMHEGEVELLSPAQLERM